MWSLYWFIVSLPKKIMSFLLCFVQTGSSVVCCQKGVFCAQNTGNAVQFCRCCIVSDLILFLGIK